MKKLVSRLPRVSIGAVPLALISWELTLSMVIGYVAAKIFSGKEEKDRGIIPSVVFSVRGYNIHLHHWFIAIGAMVAAFWLNFFLFSPVVFYGFLGGIAVQGIFQYDDWRKVITRRRKA